MFLFSISKVLTVPFVRRLFVKAVGVMSSITSVSSVVSSAASTASVSKSGKPRSVPSASAFVLPTRLFIPTPFHPQGLELSLIRQT